MKHQNLDIVAAHITSALMTQEGGAVPNPQNSATLYFDVLHALWVFWQIFFLCHFYILPTCSCA